MCRRIVTLHIRCRHESVKQEQCTEATSPFFTLFCDDYSTRYQTCGTSLCCGNHCRDDSRYKWRVTCVKLLKEIGELRSVCARQEHDYTTALKGVLDVGLLQQQRDDAKCLELKQSLDDNLLEKKRLESELETMMAAMSFQPLPDPSMLRPQAATTYMTPNDDLHNLNRALESIPGVSQQVREPTKASSFDGSQHCHHIFQQNFIPDSHMPTSAPTVLQSAAATYFRPSQPCAGTADTLHQERFNATRTVTPFGANAQQTPQHAQSSGRGRGRKGKGRVESGGRVGRRSGGGSKDDHAKDTSTKDRGSSPVRRSGRLSAKRKVTYVETSEDEEISPSLQHTEHVTVTRAGRNFPIVGHHATQAAYSRKRGRMDKGGEDDASDDVYVDTARSDHDDDSDMNVVDEAEIDDSDLALSSIESSPRLSHTVHATGWSGPSHASVKHGLPKLHYPSSNMAETGCELDALLADPKVRAFVKVLESQQKLQRHGRGTQQPSSAHNPHIYPHVAGAPSNEPLALTNDSPVPAIRLQPPVPEPHAFARQGYLGGPSKTRQTRKTAQPKLLSPQTAAVSRGRTRPLAAKTTNGQRPSLPKINTPGIEWPGHGSQSATTGFSQYNDGLAGYRTDLCHPNVLMVDAQQVVQEQPLDTTQVLPNDLAMKDTFGGSALGGELSD